MRCGYCGGEFDEKEAQKGCQSCGMTTYCGLIKCPYCDYEQAIEPSWLVKLRNMFRKGKDAVTGNLTLDMIPKDKNAVVSSINKENDKDWQKLLIFGIAPGAKIKVLQKFPSIVAQVGETQVALDTPTARLVVVKLDDEQELT